jgi:RNA methyltransferase, TrmH family
VVAAGVQDPGNLGTMIRSAEAFGATGLLIGEKTVSHLNAKAVRASAGSAFRLAIAKGKLEDAIPVMKDAGLRLAATSSHKGESLAAADLAGALALFIGNEGAGVPREVLTQMDTLLTIPHSSKVESLNAGIAASVLLYEIARQRNGNSA